MLNQEVGSSRVDTVAMVSSKTEALSISIMLSTVGFCSPLAGQFMDTG